MKPLYEFDVATQRSLIEGHLRARHEAVRFSAPMEGAYGQVFFFHQYDDNGTKIAAKCPHIVRFGSAEKARTGIENMLYELEKTHSVYMVPWVNRFFDVQIIHGWPFLLSRWRQGTLEDLIEITNEWSFADRIVCLIQIVRGLILARTRGVWAHQDLKPANILFDDITKLNKMPKNYVGMRFHCYIADFGIANAFRDFAPVKNSGSRPYMAPEQFESSPLSAGDRPSFDCFALGVIVYEILTGGMHPIGIRTADVWPWHRGVARKWDRAATWRDWAVGEKELGAEAFSFPSSVASLIKSMMSANPLRRPSLEEVEDEFWKILEGVDSLTSQAVRMQITHIEGLSTGKRPWEHMDDCLNELRSFYASK